MKDGGMENKNQPPQTILYKYGRRGKKKKISALEMLCFVHAHEKQTPKQKHRGEQRDFPTAADLQHLWGDRWKTKCRLKFLIWRPREHHPACILVQRFYTPPAAEVM